MKEKRLPCPHCGEKILPAAKKCRFCGERLDKREKQKLTIPHLYSLWLLSLIFFLLTLFSIRRAPDTFSSSWLIFFAMIVIFGVVAYLAMMIEILRSIRSKIAKQMGLISLITFVSFFGLLMHIDTVEAKLGLPPMNQKPLVQHTVQASPQPTISPVPTTSPAPRKATPTNQTNTAGKITCTGPDGKQFMTTQKECDDFNTAWGNAPTPDPNEIIRCNIHPNCGGGYKEMTRSSCEQMICCEVDYDHTVKFTSKDQCHREQEASSDKAWDETCDSICGVYDSATCANYYQPGTIGMSECISDQLSEKTKCYERCYEDQ